MPAGCGGGGPRQDEDEPAGEFPVQIEASQFPTRQRLAQTSDLVLGVRNTGDREIPNLAVTISIDKDSLRPFSIYARQPNLAVPDRPVWVLEHSYPRLVGESATAGAATANAKTFDFGPLEPGEEVEAIWKVTPVRAGTYTLDYQVDAGLAGKAKAVTADGSPPTGSFVVAITDKPPQTRVDEQGQVVVVPEKEDAGDDAESAGPAPGARRGGAPDAPSGADAAAEDVVPAG